MRIAINTRFLLKGKLEGIGWFTHEVVKRLVTTHPEHEFIFLFDRPYDPQFIYAGNITPVVLNPPARHPVLWYIWFEWSVKRALKQYKADMFISSDGFISLGSKVPALLVIHDLAFEHYPHHLPFKFRYYLRRYTPLFVQKAKHIVTVSAFTKNDLVKTYHTPAEKISVVYNGAHELYIPLPFNEKEKIREQYAGGCEYFVFAGALHPRKNVSRLLKAFAIFKRKQRSAMKLLIIGRFAWNAGDIETDIQNHPYRNDVVHYNYMQVEELSKVIAAAYAMTFVSLFEGFGIPILEAMRCKVPCIVSNCSSMPEVAGDAALLINPESEEDIAGAMITLYKDEHLRLQLAEKSILQAQKFHWDQSARDFYSVIEKNFIA